MPEVPAPRTEQHAINLIWEYTQALVAILVTVSTLYVAARLSISGTDDQTAAFVLLSNAFFLVVGFYFGRTNHARPRGLPVSSRPVTLDH